jgi:hypothetical protein
MSDEIDRIEQTTSEEAQYEVIRMFPDYADTVLWFDMPVHYSDTGLTETLVADLQKWEDTFYESLNADFEFVSRAAEAKHGKEGLKLAERVSAEVGPSFVIECDAPDGKTEKVHLRAESPAENPAAEAAFTRLRNDRIAEDKRIAEILSESGGTWTAYAPLSRTTFTPSNQTESSTDED